MRQVFGLGCGRAFLTSLSALFILLAVHSAYSQQREAPIVRSIDVQYSGPATLAKDRILAQMRTAVGQPYSDAVVEEDIRNLYKTGSVQNVRIFAQPEASGVRVIVAVQTRPVVRELVIDGVHSVKAKRVRRDSGI